MKTATQDMSITVVYGLADPDTPYTAQGDTTITFSTDDGNPSWAWSLWKPKTGYGSLILNNSGDGSGTTQLQISSFSILSENVGLQQYNQVSIVIPDGTDFSGMTLQIYLLADSTMSNGDLIDFTGSMPDGVTITIKDANEVSADCILSHGSDNSFTFNAESS